MKILEMGPYKAIHKVLTCSLFVGALYSFGVSGNASSIAQSEWNFLLNRCVITVDDVDHCNESSARGTKAGSGAYQKYFSDRVELYVWAASSVPEQFRKDFKIVLDDVRYQRDPSDGSVVVVVQQNGCITRNKFMLNPDGKTVSETTLDLAGTCERIQRRINDTQQMQQREEGPYIRKLVVN